MATKKIRINRFSIAALTILYNLQAARPIKKFSDKASAERKLNALAKEKNLTVIERGGELCWLETPAVPAKKKGGVPKKTISKRRRHTDDMVIVVLQSGSPKKISGRNPYGVYRTGLTVGKALATGDVTRRDLSWDANPKRIPGGPAIELITSEEFKARKKK